MLLYIILGIIECFVSHKQLDLASIQSASSFKDQLTLESKYHPSLLIRTALKHLLYQLEQGIPMNNILSKLGLNTQDHNLDWDDLQNLFRYMALQHPQPYPFVNLFRFLGLCAVSHTFTHHSNLPLAFAGLLVMFLASYMYYTEWLNFKITSMKLFLLNKNPLSGCSLKNNIPTPIFIKKRTLITLWQHCFTLRLDLKKTIALFHSYYEYSSLRQAKRSRQHLTILIDIAFVVIFINVIDSNFKQLYSPVI